MTILRLPHAPLLLPLAAVTLAAVLAGCGADEPARDSGPASGSAADAEEDLADVADAAGVPEECQEAFPLALEPVDPADVGFPAGWPEPPVEATLCSTGSTLDDATRTADYATTATPTEVLDAYEAALPATYETTREDQGLGEVLSGYDDTVSFQIQPAEGRFSVLLGAS